MLRFSLPPLLSLQTSLAATGSSCILFSVQEKSRAGLFFSFGDPILPAGLQPRSPLQAHRGEVEKSGCHGRILADGSRAPAAGGERRTRTSPGFFLRKTFTMCACADGAQRRSPPCGRVRHRLRFAPEPRTGFSGGERILLLSTLQKQVERI